MKMTDIERDLSDTMYFDDTERKLKEKEEFFSRYDYGIKSIIENQSVIESQTLAFSSAIMLGQVISFSVPFLSVVKDEVKTKFKEFTKAWKKETGGMSSPSSIWMNRNYQKIIGLGPEVIPLILKELAREHDDWFYALEMLVDDKDNPVTEEMGFNDSVAAWLKWGKDSSLI